ncbi:hypothetical protein COT83_05635 [Candidatus Peregrinibacteria bacterium CG10_big_fil_rev_8_21_14_0_10_44_7]|nr:MAG: hypothetical protein AUK45_03270 [Candidatus Peregrinibacteria bacterium CG2_30_44_17]PIS03520.1 MAG: hypothetical protein COT83_05635 [Candidatus Peregrinibacteria bacterium CG10_big_fil_rev_8_21_14_0_10_44_7]PIX80251.1 MAG: hypothetical protein COZ35_01345 [Candidatus Peregrinibacteria bacterium CG_4_10_14_3_um_filter_44_21]PJB89557.1 MAG: hypothetical protein CO082_00495 [Candidatus Peregrinibacteria bacterium CG_4_9_14_0_8_um_filter_44_15]
MTYGADFMLVIPPEDRVVRCDLAAFDTLDDARCAVHAFIIRHCGPDGDASADEMSGFDDQGVLHGGKGEIKMFDVVEGQFRVTNEGVMAISALFQPGNEPSILDCLGDDDDVSADAF